MKKSIVLTALLAACFFSYAQEKKDTVVVPAMPYTDTVSKMITYGDATGVVRYTYGYLLVSGFVIRKDGKQTWAEQPKITGFIDNKKKPLKNVIQWFDIK